MVHCSRVRKSWDLTRLMTASPLFQAHAITHGVQDAVRAQIAAKHFARVLVHIEPTLPIV